MCVCLLNPLSNSKNCKYTSESEERRNGLGREFIWWIFCCFCSCQYQAMLITAVFLLTFPTSCSPACPIQQELPAFVWLFSLAILLQCYSFLIGFISRFTLSSAWAISRGPGFICCSSPFLILFISTDKYVNTETVMCCLISRCSFMVKNVWCSPASLPPCLKVNDPAQCGLYKRSLWSVYSYIMLLLITLRP